MYRRTSRRARAELTREPDTQAVGTAETTKPPPKALYGYIRIAIGNEERAAALKADLQVFCRSNGYMLSTVYTDRDVDDQAIARPGFSSLLDICQILRSHGVVVPSRMHLSPHEPTLTVLLNQIQRTGAVLIAVDETVAAGPAKGGNDAHA
jgi:hypothetical protein